MTTGSGDTVRPIPPWRDGTVARLDHLRRLAPGWDGYAGRPVDAATADRTLAVLENLCGAGTPVPAIVPGPSGDLQIEWHTAAWDIEIHVDASSAIDAWRGRAAGTDDGETLSVAGSFAALRAWIREIDEPTRVASTA